MSAMLVVVGLCCVSAYIWIFTDGFVYQSVQQHYFPGAPPPGEDERPSSMAPVLEVASRPPEWMPRILRPDPAVLARLEIPRLNLSVMVREGTDAGTLRRAVGHIPSTALPGRTGNFVVTGHRDTFFRPLRGIARGDAIRAITRTHVYIYRVYALSVVSPDQIGALNPTNRPECTLVTCFPFDYIGPASRRLIIQAHLIEPLAESPARQTE
jgi:sortase A